MGYGVGGQKPKQAGLPPLHVTKWNLNPSFSPNQNLINYGLESFDGNHSLSMTSETVSLVRGSWQAMERTLPTELNAPNSIAAWAPVLLAFPLGVFAFFKPW